MKQLFVLLTIIMFSYHGYAQDYTSIRNSLATGLDEKAKADLDKAWAAPGFTSNAEAFLLKAAVYSTLAMDERNRMTTAGDQLNADAEAAFSKYTTMDKTMKLVTDAIYQNAPVNLYSYYYNDGYKDYSAKNWTIAFSKLKNAVRYSDLLIEKKLLPVQLDTNVLILAAITSENSGAKDEAAKYYGRLADNKIAGEGFESVYRFMVTYAFGKKDMVSFKKYKKNGSELYPLSDFFRFDEVDFAVGLAGKFPEKLKTLESLVLSSPDNYKAWQVMGELIYDELNPQDEKAALPANAPELESKMLKAFNKSAILKPGSELPFLYTGDYFINKAVRINGAKENANADAAKKQALEKDYGIALNAASQPYQKAVSIFAKKTPLADKDKLQYKKAVSYLADISEYNRVMAKSDVAEKQKWAAEQKKWNDLYETIK